MVDLRVLLADDEPELLDVIARMLERYGDAVCTRKSSCAAAIAHYKQDSDYHLVLTDLKQDPSGVDLARFVRQNHGSLDTRVGIMTGNAPDELIKEAKSISDFFLEKPFSIPQIKEIVFATKIYFSRVGVNQNFPKEWYVDDSHKFLLVLGAEGNADKIDEVIARLKNEHYQKLDWSPVMSKLHFRNPWTLTIGNVYAPDVCTLQVGQDIVLKDEKRYTSVVSSGIGDVVKEVMAAFIEKSGFVVKSPTISFVTQVEADQFPFKIMCDEAFNNFDDIAAVKDVLSASLKIKQEGYRARYN